jgi:N-acetylmuramoyl-L-alanine amidase
LAQRTRIANEVKGKLFISVHTNSAASRSASGIEVYILAPGKRDESAVRVAERENKVVLEFEDNPAVYESMTQNQLMKLNMMESGFMRESEYLAALLSNHMTRTANTQTRGVKQNIFYVLWGASMPRVLVEIGYLTNANERKNLDSPRYRQQLAQGMFAGIEEFIRQHQRTVARQGE